MTARLYSSLVQPTTLTAEITNASNSLLLSVASNANFPASPFTLVIDPDTENEEVVTVVSGSSSPYTITRNAEGSGLKTHAFGALVKHMITARDLQEPQKHIEATGAYSITNPKDDSGVTSATIVKTLHGIDSNQGFVVGTDKPQTLTAKIMSGSNNTFTNIPSTAISGNFTQDKITDLVSNLAAKAPIDSPVFTTSVTIPTGSTINGSSLDGTFSPLVTTYTFNSPTISNATLTNNTTANGSILFGTNGNAIKVGSGNTTIISSTELGYLDGVTSAIQGQITAKAAKVSPSISDPTLTGTVTITDTVTGGTINPTVLKQNSITLPLAFASGTGTFTTSASTNGSSGTIGFPAGRFTQTPVVVITSENSAFNMAATTVNSSGFQATGRHIDGTSTSSTFTFDWIAIQQTSAAYSPGVAQ